MESSLSRGSRCSFASTTWTSCSASPTWSPSCIKDKCSRREPRRRSAPIPRSRRSTSATSISTRLRRRPAPVLEVSNLQVRYGKSHVVFDMGLKVGRGEVVALLGRNGAGKTTTIMGIVGLIGGTTGSVVIDGVDVGRCPAFRRAQSGIAYVPSGARCFAPLTVEENLHIAARATRNGGAPSWTVERVYEVFPKLQQLRANLAGGLSGGERQMLAVGRGLMLNPKVILLDEPTEGLAPVIVQGLAALIRTLRDTGVGILLAEQNHQMALKVADRAAFIEKGRIAAELPAADARTSDVVHRILGV